MTLPATGEGNTVTEASDGAVEPGRVAFRQPPDGAYGAIGRGRRAEAAPDGNRVHCCRPKATGRGAWGPICRKGFEDAGERLRIEDAPEWVDARRHHV